MTFDNDHLFQARTKKISVCLTPTQYNLVDEAANNEGLRLSSFMIMLLVRLHILPDSSLKKLKRRPVPFFNELHALLGAVNKIGGHCKQLAAVMPETKGLDEIHASLTRAAYAITDILRGKKIPAGVSLYRLQSDLTKAGQHFNDIVKSINTGNPDLSDLVPVLTHIHECAEAISAALTGQPIRQVDTHEAIMEKAMDEMRLNMRKAEAQQAGPNGDQI